MLGERTGFHSDSFRTGLFYVLMYVSTHLTFLALWTILFYAKAYEVFGSASKNCKF